MAQGRFSFYFQDPGALAIVLNFNTLLPRCASK
jgi:hypothetical protein